MINISTGWHKQLISTKFLEGEKTADHRIVNIVGPQKDIGVHTDYLLDPDAKLWFRFCQVSGKTLDLSEEIENSDIYFSRFQESGNSNGIRNIPNRTTILITSTWLMKNRCEVLIKHLWTALSAIWSWIRHNDSTGFFSDEPGFMNEEDYRNILWSVSDAMGRTSKWTQKIFWRRIPQVLLDLW